MMLFVALFVVLLVGIGQHQPYRWVHVVTVATVAVALLPVNMENTKSIWFILGFVAVSCPVWLTKDELSASVNLEVSRVQTRPRHIKAG